MCWTNEDCIQMWEEMTLEQSGVTSGYLSVFRHRKDFRAARQATLKDMIGSHRPFLD